MAITTKKYLDSAGLTHFWGKTKNYIDNNSTTMNNNFTKIVEEIELNPDTLEYTGVYVTTNSVRSDIASAKVELDGLKDTITGINELSYDDIDVALGFVVVVGPNYLKFTAKEDNSTISLDAQTSPDIKYSLNNGGDWTQWDYNAITLNTGDTVYMKGNNSNGFSTSSSSCNQFKMTGKIGASGNIMSLLHEDDFEGKLTIPCDYCFYSMFKDCTSLTTAPELPATTLAIGCYHSMFKDCTSLTTAPELPATTLTDYCFYSMFYGCTSLTTAPELPATTLAESCYEDMLRNCTSLTTAQELPATTLTKSCYASMFSGCTSLTTAPELPAGKLTYRCYSFMFSGCIKLNYIKMLATNVRASNCLNNWIKDVASTGTFVKHPNMSVDDLNTGYAYSGLPEGWTVEDAVI